MAKAPVAGTVKTRLFPPFSPEEAAEVYRCLFLDQIDNLSSFKDADLFIPDDAAPLFKQIVPSPVICFSQRGEGLGERMNHCFTELFARGYRNTLLVGSTCQFSRFTSLRKSIRY
jgi:uncharacterized protein